MKVIAPRQIFEKPGFDECFTELFTMSDGKIGPLGYIFRNFPLAVGKGGATYLTGTGKDEPDMSYFVHVLNASIIAGRMLERDMISERKDIDKLKNKIRLFFSAIVLHDINKLFVPNNGSRAWRLDLVFDEHRPDILKIEGAYMETLGEPSGWLNDLKYLIMITEERTRELAGSVSTTLPRPELEEIGRYLKLGDQVSSGTGGTDSFEIYCHIKEKLSSFDSSSGSDISGMKLQFIKIPNIPQTLLRLKFIDEVADELIESEREIVVRTPDSIVFYGNSINKEFVERLSERVRVHIYGVSPDTRYLKGFPPGSNKIPFEWAKSVDPSPEVADRYIDLFYSRLLLWSGKKWRESHPNFPSTIFSRWGIEIETIKGPEIKFRVKSFGDSSDDPDIALKKLLAQIAAAKRMLLELENGEIDRNEEPEASEFNDGADAIQKKTNISLAYAGRWKGCPEEECKEEYNQLLGKLSEQIRNKYPLRQDDIAQDVRYMLGWGFPDTDEKLLNIPDKTEMCFQCGRASKESLTDDNSFGFKATSGGGRKLTKLSYNEKYNSRICNLCSLENRLRKGEFKDVLDPKRKEALAIQIFLGDFITTVDLSQIISAMDEDTKKKFDDDLNVKLSEREKMQLNYHALGFLNKFPDIKSQFFLLRRMLDLVSTTGFKIHLTPLFNSERILKPMFTWENAPGWVKELHWDSIRIDKVKDVKRELEFLYFVAKMRRGADDVPDVVNARVRNPGSVILKMWEYNAGRKQDEKNKKTWKKLSSLEEEEMYYFLEKYAELLNMNEMEKMVEAACKMVNKPPETNNDDKWMIDAAFEVYERGVAEKRDSFDRVKGIAGRLREKALRDSTNIRKDVETGAQEFADSFVELVKNGYGGRVPRSESRRDITAEFALLYHSKKWGNMKKKEGV